MGQGLRGTIPVQGGWALPEGLLALQLNANQQISGSIPSSWVLPPGESRPARAAHTSRPPAPPHPPRPTWLTCASRLPAGLQILRLDWTQISGTLSPDWSPGANITYLNLASANLTGPLPERWSLPSIVNLDLSSEWQCGRCGGRELVVGSPAA